MENEITILTIDMYAYDYTFVGVIVVDKNDISRVLSSINKFVYDAYKREYFSITDETIAEILDVAELNRLKDDVKTNLENDVSEYVEKFYFRELEHDYDSEKKVTNYKIDMNESNKHPFTVKINKIKANELLKLE